MKRSLLLAVIPLVFGSSPVWAKSELETLRALCAEQERQIRQLEQENARLHEEQKPKAPDKPATVSKAAASDKPAAAVPATSKPASPKTDKPAALAVAAPKADKSTSLTVAAAKAASPTVTSAKPPTGKAPVAAATAAKAGASQSTSPAKPGIRSVTLTGTTTYGEFAAKHGTNVRHLNDLNALDLVETTVLAKGSELYIPAQP